MKINLGGTRTPNLGVEGFSVLEAVIALAITGLALTVIYSVGSRASQLGFGLGRRVLSVGESEIHSIAIHTLISGMVVPTGLDPAAGNANSPAPLVGDANFFRGENIAPRTNLCGAAGLMGVVTLTIVRGPDGSQLQCQTSSSKPQALSDFPRQSMHFSYSADGISWDNQVQIAPGPRPGEDKDAIAIAMSRTVFVRLSSDDGSTLILEKATTGRPRRPALDPKTALQ